MQSGSCGPLVASLTLVEGLSSRRTGKRPGHCPFLSIILKSNGAAVHSGKRRLGPRAFRYCGPSVANPTLMDGRKEDPNASRALLVLERNIKKKWRVCV